MAETGKRVEEDYKMWKKENHPNSRFIPMEMFKLLTHCTKADLKKDIVKNGLLKKCYDFKEWEEPLAQDDAPEGVWFGITMGNSLLPSISPFGTERVLKPVESLQTDLGSCNPVLYLEAIKFRENTRNVRLILLKGDDEESIDWCEEQCLYELDIHDNPFLTINMTECVWIWKTLKNGPEGEKPDTWVAVFIARDVDVTGCTWDTVEQYGYSPQNSQYDRRNHDRFDTRCFICGKRGHWMDSCPKRECFRCGGYDHWAEDCPRFCTKCGQYGHRSPECSELVCFTCGKLGHFGDKCQKTKCFRCGGYGHWADDCSSGYTTRRHFGQRRPDQSEIGCVMCGQLGHRMDNCPNTQCFQCDGYGHWAEDCPSDYTTSRHFGQRKPDHFKIACVMCGQLGHSMDNCPNTQCFRCEGYGHWAEDCPRNCAKRRRSETDCYTFR
ncbi:uncharacterized protein LOC110463133 isoform X2 [Mizuhopecten yessoensis]|uniref:DNA-binding protein HEXBP n=1 Tax=Mizuhopecten yessoensis TaxID=6573 RepID=A0A210PWV8_MIZYE|nr:uncharacterized protein LOC110463133 isoform X2 [Mizuhopecten yessoensis]OWF40955.1 DNA-binding protein HEXBP [Mizuhopecten yessoensis]